MISFLKKFQLKEVVLYEDHIISDLFFNFLNFFEVNNIVIPGNAKKINVNGIAGLISS